MCWESEWVTHVYCLLCFFPSPVITHWSPHCFPWSSDVVQNPTQQPSIHWLFQGETYYCCPICLAVIQIRTVVPSSLSGYQLWQKIPPKLWGERYGMKNSLLGFRNMAEAEKTAEGNGEGLSLRLQNSPRSWIGNIRKRSAYPEFLILTSFKLMILVTGKSFWVLIYLRMSVCCLYSESYKITGSNILPSKPSEGCSIWSAQGKVFIFYVRSCFFSLGSYNVQVSYSF